MTTKKTWRPLAAAGKIDYMKKGKLRYLYRSLCVVGGLLLATIGYRVFLIPNEIAPGGFTGIGQLAGALWGWKVGVVALALNVPLFIIGIKSVDWKFALLSLAATFALSAMLDYMPVNYVSEDLVLSSIFGGILSGVGFGLILRGGASTGGTDMLAKIIHEQFRFVSVGAVMFTVDFLVVFASMFVFDVTRAMYAIIALFISSWTLDRVIDGLNTAKAYFVISRNSAEISRRVMDELDHGVTALKGRGEYSGRDMDVLLCVVYRLEAPRLRRIIAECDKTAFVIATDVREALGEGFDRRI